MPFCKICFDAKRADYLDHNIKTFIHKTNTFEVTCKYLKSIVCANCGNKGHTTKYCSVKKAVLQNKDTTNNINKCNKNVVTCSALKAEPSKKTSNTYNMFALLCDDSDEESENIYDLCSYTADGELIGRVCDIVWGRQLSANQSRWADIY